MFVHVSTDSTFNCAVLASSGLIHSNNSVSENGRQPKCKTTNMEEDQNKRRTKWKTTKMEDDHNGSQPKRKMTIMEVNQNEKPKN